MIATKAIASWREFLSSKSQTNCGASGQINTERLRLKWECLETEKFMLTNMHTKITVEELVVFMRMVAQ